MTQSSRVALSIVVMAALVISWSWWFTRTPSGLRFHQYLPPNADPIGVYRATIKGNILGTDDLLRLETVRLLQRRRAWHLLGDVLPLIDSTNVLVSMAARQYVASATEYLEFLGWHRNESGMETPWGVIAMSAATTSSLDAAENVAQRFLDAVGRRDWLAVRSLAARENQMGAVPTDVELQLMADTIPATLHVTNRTAQGGVARIEGLGVYDEATNSTRWCAIVLTNEIGRWYVHRIEAIDNDEPAAVEESGSEGSRGQPQEE